MCIVGVTMMTSAGAANSSQCRISDVLYGSLLIGGCNIQGDKAHDAPCTKVIVAKVL